MMIDIGEIENYKIKELPMVDVPDLYNGSEASFYGYHQSKQITGIIRTPLGYRFVRMKEECFDILVDHEETQKTINSLKK